MWSVIIEYLWELFNIYSLNVMSIISWMFEPLTIFGQRFYPLEIVFGSGFVLYAAAGFLFKIFK